MKKIHFALLLFGLFSAASAHAAFKTCNIWTETDDFLGRFLKDENQKAFVQTPSAYLQSSGSDAQLKELLIPLSDEKFKSNYEKASKSYFVRVLKDRYQAILNPDHLLPVSKLDLGWRIRPGETCQRQGKESPCTIADILFSGKAGDLEDFVHVRDKNGSQLKEARIHFILTRLFLEGVSCPKVLGYDESAESSSIALSESIQGALIHLAILAELLPQL